MTSLESWIDPQVADWMKALVPQKASGPAAVPEDEVVEDEGFLVPVETPGLAPLPAQAAAAPVIAPDPVPDAAVIERMRHRLSSIRQRAERDGLLRVPPEPARRLAETPAPACRQAEIPPVVPLPPHPEPPPGTSAPKSAFSLPWKDLAPPARLPVDLPVSEPLPAGAPVAVPPLEPLSAAAQAPSASAPVLVEENGTGNVPHDGPAVAPPSGPAAASPPPAAAAAVFAPPDGPLAARLEAYREWLQARFGWQQPMVFDRHGCPLHATRGLGTFIAAAVSLGVAWREATALADPPHALRAAHAAWGGGTMGVLPVPTRYSDLFVAALVPAAIDGPTAEAVAAGLRRAAGL